MRDRYEGHVTYGQRHATACQATTTKQTADAMHVYETDRDGDGCVRLHVNTDESWSLEACDRLSALIEAASALRDALRLAESALAVRASLRDGEQSRNQAALDAARAALALAEGGAT